MGLIAGPVAQPIVRPVVGGWRTLSRRFADILKGRTAIVYDPQDLATMYQDSTGTLPVYRPGSGAVDPPVGLLLDKSLGLELGPELVVNGTFDYDLTGCSVVGSSSTKQIALESQSIRVSASTTGTCVALFGLSTPLVIGRWYMIKITCLAQASGTSLNEVYMGGGGKVVGSFPSPGVKTFFASAPSAYTSVGVGRVANGTNELTFSQWDNVSVREIKGYHAYQTTTTARPKLSGRYNLLTATETLSTQSVTTAAADYTLRFEGTGSITLSGAATGVLSAGTHTVTCTEGSLTLTVAGVVTRADLRVKRDGSSLPPYQRVDSATTYDTNGFPLYLRRDKVDDDLIVQAPAITGSWAHGTIDGPVLGTVAIPAGEYRPFGVLLGYGLPDCTQWIAIDGALTASGQAVLERYVYSKARQLIDVPQLSGASTLENALHSRSEIKTIDAARWLLLNNKLIKNSFNSCVSLVEISGNSLVTAKTVSIRGAFNGCSSLQSIDISGWDTSALVEAYYTFGGCTALSSVVVGSAFNNTPCTSFASAFYNTNLNQESIDAILVSINTAGTSNGTFNQSGGSAPSATGQAAITAMRSRGWTVTVTGGF